MATADPELLRLRDSIDNIDAALVHLLAERFKCTQAVGEYKAKHGLPPPIPAREQIQIARLRALAKDAKLDPDFAEQFLAFIVKEVIRHHEAIRGAWPGCNAAEPDAAMDPAFSPKKKPSGRKSAPSSPRPSPSCRKISAPRNRPGVQGGLSRLAQLLYKKGWVAPAWPKEYGGAGWSVTQRYIFDTRRAKAEMPTTLPFGLGMVGPVIYTFGSEAQKKKFLPRILSGEDWWCQGYSEPGAGSDLACLRTRAVREGDHYIVNGQKTWTTLAQYADWIFCLVRTDPERQAAGRHLFLLIDMKSPGITVKPIIMLDGAREVNEVFFDDVKVPVENRVGEENKGWTYAKFLLAHERSGIAGVGALQRGAERLKKIARTEARRRRATDRRPRFRAQDRGAGDRSDGAGIHRAAHPSRRSQGREGGPESSILKIGGSEIQQRIADLAMEAVGYYALSRRRSASATTNRRSGRTMRAGWRDAISTCARPRSMAARTRSSATSSPKPCWGSDGFHGFPSPKSRPCCAIRCRAIWPTITALKRGANSPRAEQAAIPRHWQQFAELGLLAARRCRKPMAGWAAAPVETMVVMEEFGRALVVEPYVPTVVIGGGLAGAGRRRRWRKKRCPRSRPAKPSWRSPLPKPQAATISPTSTTTAKKQRRLPTFSTARRAWCSARPGPTR